MLGGMFMLRLAIIVIATISAPIVVGLGIKLIFYEYGGWAAVFSSVVIAVACYNVALLIDKRGRLE